MAVIPEVLFNMSASVGGVSLQGDVPSLTLPKLTMKTDEYRGGGMDAPIEMDMGLEKLEASFTSNGMRRETLKYFGDFDLSGFNCVFRGSFKGRGGATKAVVATLRGALKEVDPGEWKVGDKAEMKHSIAVSYYKLEVGGRVIYEIDPVNCIRVIDGVDQLASVRADLAI